MTKTVSVTCPCGTEFEREVKRGRPAVWCPACREIPMDKRVRNVEGDAKVTDMTAPRRKHDVVPGDQREQIEANVAEVNRQWREEIVPNKETLFADAELGVDRAASDWYHDALQQAYTSVTSNWWTSKAS